jgi:glycosyltransferase involved in cell wall biosynthesis
MHGVAKYELLYHNTLKRAFYSFLDKINLKFANKIIVMSYPMKKYLVEEGIKGDRIHVIWGPVDTQKYKYKKLKPSEFYLVGYGGGSQFWSGFGTIIEASKKIDNPNIKFIIVGGLPKDVSNKRFTNVEFMGKLDEAKYFEILSNCNVLLSVRVGDRVAELQYPQKLSAYLAMGRPIIASDVNDQRYILERAKCGVVIKPDDPDELIRAILHLYQIQNSQPELIEEMGIMGRKFAEENLSFEVFAKKLREVYQLNRENSW